jgi:hypothetical protein
MRVRCVRLFKSSNPGYGEPIDEHPRLRVGQEFVVLSVLVDGSLWRVALQLLDRSGDRSWYPAGMFETVSTTLPSNWVVQVWPDGSLHLAPEAWLRGGFFDGFVDGQRNGAAWAAILDRELSIILEES